MDNKWTLVGLFLALLALTFQSVSAISCYKCNSKTDAGCDTTPPSSKYMMECGELKEGSKYDRCRKIDQWVDKEMEGMKPNQRVIRDCGWGQGDDERTCYYRAGFGGRQNVCTCQSDNCNGASNIASTAFAIISGVALCFLGFTH